MKSDPMSPFGALHFAAALLKGDWNAIILFCLLPIAALEAGVILATRAAASRLIASDVQSNTSMTAGAGMTALLLGAVIVFMIIRTIGVTLLWAAALRYVKTAGAQLSGTLFSSYLHWPYMRVIGRAHTRIFENMRTASRTVPQEIVTPLLTLISEIMVAIAILLALLVIAPAATLLLIGWFTVIFGLLLRVLSRRSRHLAQQKWRIFHKLQELDNWTFRQFRHVRLTAQEEPLIQRHKLLSTQSGWIGANLFLLGTLPRQIGEIALLGSILILFGWFSLQNHDPELIMKEIAVLSVASLRLLPAGQRAVSLAHQLQQKMPALRDMLADLAEPTLDLPAPDATHNTAASWAVLTLENASFEYESGPPVIAKATNLHVLRGEWLHVSGPSGTGKTTLVSILLGLLAPSRGNVMIDGQAVDMLRAWRCGGVTMIPQDPTVVAGTIHENLSFPFATSAIDATRACKLLAAVGIERDLDARIGSEGANLSGGQKQKLAIVRALLLSPELLVLDEATSQIDREGEAAIFELIRHELPASTVIIIAHKLESHDRFDRIWAHKNDQWSNVALAQPAQCFVHEGKLT
jgi:ABC-type bacteriocin/lantibiotic exporter with double-glycine peptidase domain